MEVRLVSHDSPKLLDRMRAEIRLRHYSLRTQQSYVDWTKRYLLFHGKKHPQELSVEAVRDFLSHRTSERNVAASTQNQTKSAVLFLYKQVLKIELPWLSKVIATKSARRLPVVLTPTEARRLLQSGGFWWFLIPSALGQSDKPVQRFAEHIAAPSVRQAGISGLARQDIPQALMKDTRLCGHHFF